MSSLAVVRQGICEQIREMVWIWISRRFKVITAEQDQHLGQDQGLYWSLPARQITISYMKIHLLSTNIHQLHEYTHLLSTSIHHLQEYPSPFYKATESMISPNVKLTSFDVKMLMKSLDIWHQIDVTVTWQWCQIDVNIFVKMTSNLT